MFRHGRLFWVLYCLCVIRWCFCDLEEFIWLPKYLHFCSLLIRELKPQVFVNFNNSVASHFTSKRKFIQEEPEKWRPWTSNLWWTLGQFREQKRGADRRKIGNCQLQRYSDISWTHRDSLKRQTMITIVISLSLTKTFGFTEIFLLIKLVLSIT